MTEILAQGTGPARETGRQTRSSIRVHGLALGKVPCPWVADGNQGSDRVGSVGLQPRPTWQNEGSPASQVPA